MKDRFNQNIEVGDIVIFSTIGEMAEGVVTKLGRYRKIMVKNSGGYIKSKLCNHVINKTKLEINASSLFI